MQTIDLLIKNMTNIRLMKLKIYISSFIPFLYVNEKSSYSHCIHLHLLHVANELRYRLDEFFPIVPVKIVIISQNHVVLVQNYPDRLVNFEPWHVMRLNQIRILSVSVCVKKLLKKLKKGQEIKTITTYFDCRQFSNFFL